jgi:hypothetical protein
MDRLSQTELHFGGVLTWRARCLIGLVFLGTAGCGGGSEPVADGSSNGVPAVADSPADTSLATQPPSTGGQTPPKELTNGMTLPDEVMVGPQETPDSSGPESQKGMQLPDGLGPSE